MELFHLIEEGVAILRAKGRIFKQTKIYRRGEDVFAPWGGGFIKLSRGGGTALPDLTVIEIEGPGVVIVQGVPKFVDAEAAAEKAA